MGIETPMYPWLNVSSMGVTTEQQQLSFPRTVSPLLLLLIRWNESLRNPRFIIPASLNVPSPPLFSLFDKDQTIVPLPIKASTARKNNFRVNENICSVSQFCTRLITRLSYIIIYSIMKFKFYKFYRYSIWCTKSNVFFFLVLTRCKNFLPRRTINYDEFPRRNFSCKWFRDIFD